MPSSALRSPFTAGAIVEVPTSSSKAEDSTIPPPTPPANMKMTGERFWKAAPPE